MYRKRGLKKYMNMMYNIREKESKLRRFGRD